MHTQLAMQLLIKLKEGTISPSEMNVARQFLRDNNIEARRNANPNMKLLNDALKGFKADKDE